MKARIETIQNKYKKKEASNRQPIYIRDVIVYQPQLSPGARPPAGEFFHTNTRLSTPLSKIKKETEPELIARMIAYIKQLADQAASVHRVDNANEITRLSLQEFALYPHEERGPLSIHGFNDLLSQMDTLAANYPQNLQLMLGTVAVKVNDVLQNIALIVQCGPIPQIHTVAKAIPSGLDPSYSKALTAPYTRMKYAEKDIYALKNALKGLKAQFNKGTLQQNEWLNLRKLCAKLHADTNILKQFDDIKINFTKSVASISNETRQKLISLFDMINDYRAKIAEFQIQEVKNNPPSAALLPPGGEATGMIEYASLQTMNTAEGAMYIDGIEICLDHSYGVLKQKFIASVANAIEGEEEVLPIKRTHTVLSNSASLIHDFLIGTATQSDPIVSAQKKSVMNDKQFVMPEKTFTLTQTSFGSTTQIHVFPLREIKSSGDAIEKSIEKHNQFIIQLKSYHHERAHRLTSMFLVNQEIDALILQPVIRTLTESNQSALQSFADELKRSYGEHETELRILANLANFLKAQPQTSAEWLPQVITATKRIQREQRATAQLRLSFAKANDDWYSETPKEDHLARVSFIGTSNDYLIKNGALGNFFKFDWANSCAALGATLGFWRYPSPAQSVVSDLPKELIEKQTKISSAYSSLANQQTDMRSVLLDLCGRKNLKHPKIAIVEDLIVKVINGDLPSHFKSTLQKIKGSRNERFKALLNLAEAVEAYEHELRYKP